MRSSAVRSVRGVGTAQWESRKLCRIDAIANESTMAAMSEARRHAMVLRGRLTEMDTGSDSADNAREDGASSA